MDYSEYKMAIRSSLKTETIFLKRKPRDVNVNQFNPIIFALHQANTDIQFILNPYALVNYLVNYIQKPMKSISKLLNDAAEETKAGNFSHRQKLLKIGNKFVNGVEISAQEAAYILLGLKMSEASLVTVFVNTFPQKSRIRMIKPKSVLSKMDSNSTDVFQHNQTDRYPYRPDDLNDICLADFYAW